MSEFTLNSAGSGMTGVLQLSEDICIPELIYGLEVLPENNTVPNFTSPRTSDDKHTKMPVRRKRKMTQMRRKDGKDGTVQEDSDRTRSRYMAVSFVQDRQLSGKNKSSKQLREASSNSDVGLLEHTESSTKASKLCRDDETKPVIRQIPFTPVVRKASSSNLMAQSPDSGFDLNCSSLLSSPPLCRRSVLDSGVESDMDTSDLGTPMSELAMNGFQEIQTAEKTRTMQNTTKKLRWFLQKKYVSIKDELDPEELADILYAKDLIRKGDREKITQLTFRDGQSDLLIKSLVRKSEKTDEHNDEMFVKMVRDSFKEAKYGYIFDNFEDFTVPDNSPDFEMNPIWKDRLSYFSLIQGDEIDSIQIIDELLAKEVLTFDEHQSILDARTKQDKISNLIESVRRKSRRHYNDFCAVIKEEYPKASEMLYDESTYTEMDTSQERRSLPNFEMALLKETTRDEGETEVKLTVIGAEGEERELEQMIVDQHSPKPSEKLVEMVTSDVHCGFKISFSCIKVTFECMSERSRMLLVEKCKQSPNFLASWIKELFDAEKLNMLKQKKIKEVKCRIQVNWLEVVLNKQDIARNYGYLKKNFEPKDYSKIFVGLHGAQDIMKMILSDEAREVRCREFILYMVTSENAPIEKLSTELKGTDVMKYLIGQKRLQCQRRCTCKLTKKTIVANFSSLEKQLERVEEIIEIFEKFPGFDSTIKSQFHDVKQKESLTAKTEAFLRKILDLPDDGFQVCLFEDALVRTDQQELLKRLLNKQPCKTELLITKDDVSRNISFLRQELEPMRFISMLSEQNDADQVREKILEAHSRRQRCNLFLEYLQNCDPPEMEKFSAELQRLNLTNIIGFLLSSRRQGLAENKITKDDISQNRSFLEDMLDPMELWHILIDNENDKSRKALDKVLSASKKGKKRIKEFLDVMISSEENVFSKFASYLENERPNIVTFLANSREHQDLKVRSVLESLLDSYSLIVSEVEPFRLKNMFVERQAINNEEFDSICSNPTRRRRAVQLMEKVLKGPISRAQCMIEALESVGYISLVKQIRCNEESFKQCPRLYRLTQGGDECIAFEGVVQIQFDEATADGIADRIMPKNIDLSHVIKNQYIYQWLNNSIDTATFTTTSDAETSKYPVIASTFDGERYESMDPSSKKRQKIQECNYSGTSSPSSSLFRRVEEAGEVCPSCMSNMSDCLEVIENDLKFDRVRHDLTSISDDYAKRQSLERPTSEDISKIFGIPDDKICNSVEVSGLPKPDSVEQPVCSCSIRSENISQSDSRMGECKLHALYYIQ